MNQDVVALGFLIGLIVALLFGLHLLRQRCRDHAEWFRKVLHIGSGLLACSFPFLFQSVWPVLVLGFLSLILVTGLRGFDKKGIGMVLKGETRTSYGDLYFPISVMILWLLSRHNLVLYFIPILVLTFSDTVAALVGIYYGKVRYKTLEGFKSTEGSIAFFLVAFLLTHIFLLLMAPVSKVSSLLIGVLIGLLLMMIESVAWRGLDNLLIPVCGFFLLKSFILQSEVALATHLGTLCVLAMIGWLWRTKATLSDNALMVGILYIYFCWTLTAPFWAIPPLVLFVSYTLLTPSTKYDSYRLHNLQALGGICLPGLFWVILFLVTKNEMFFALFLTTFAVHMPMIGFIRFKRARSHLSEMTLIMVGSLVGALFVGLFLYHRWDLVVLSGASILGSSFFFSRQISLKGYDLGMDRWLLQGSCSFGASLPLLAVFFK